MELLFCKLQSLGEQIPKSWIMLINSPSDIYDDIITALDVEN